LTTNRPSPALRAIPAVERVLQALGPLDLPRPTLTALIRRQLAELRKQTQVPGFDVILQRVRSSADALGRTRLQAVVNGTGILVHTNLGRAPLGPETLQALHELGVSYSNLEYNLEAGERGGRATYLESNLALLCGAEAATVVNNCAAALVLALRYLTRAKPEVVISRGELVQIGGGFRIPEILEASGARLREIGTTNKTDLDDYAQAIGSETGLILKVHRSNFFMGGFVESAGTEEIAALARRKRVPFVEDLGSGAIISTEKLAAVEHEPTPSEVLKRGVDLVTFSGDKLLGGPQAGIIAGRGRLVHALKREPFFRALRCDKLILSALQSTVDLYLDGKAPHAVPVLTMLQVSTEELRVRAEKIVSALRGFPGQVSVGSGNAQIGGGTLPRSVIPSVTVDTQPAHSSLAELATALRRSSPPVIGYTAAGKLKLDLRTIFPAQDAAVMRALQHALTLHACSLPSDGV
jgi:L-seryl-tRNA(Ser) seleniumtransferase